MSVFLSSILGGIITVTIPLVIVRCIIILMNARNSEEYSLGSALKKCKKVIFVGVLILSMTAIVTYIKSKYI